MSHASPRVGRHRAAGAAAITTLAMLVASSCRESTAIVLEARTGLAPSALRGVSFTVGSPGTTERGPVTAVTNDARVEGGDTFIGTLVVVPGSAEDAPLSIKVIAAVGPAANLEGCSEANAYRGCIVARRSLRYVPHMRLQLPIRLDPRCIDVPCDAQSTCAVGACVSSDVSCVDSDCALPGELAPGDEREAAAPDAPDAVAAQDGATRDAPQGDSAGNDATVGARSIKCPGRGGDCTGTDACCIESASMGFCTAAGSFCPTPAVIVQCDSRDDCAGGEHCCYDGKSSCSPFSCGLGNEVCSSDSDCDAPAHCTNLKAFASTYNGCQ